MSITLICFLSSLAWGIAPLFGKLGLRNISPMAGLAIRTVVTSVFIAGALLAGSGFASIRRATAADCLFIALESLLATFAGDLAYYAALKYGDVASTASILAASPVITLWLASGFLKERVGVWQIIGTLLVFLGLLLVVRK